MIGNPAGFDYEATLAACAQGNRTALRELYEREARWLMGVAMRIVRHRALQEVRRIAPLASADAPDVEELAAEEPMSGESASGIDGEALERCLEQLEPQRRECIVQAFVEGYSHAPIAARVGKPVGTVKSWVRRGLMSLKDCLS